MKSLKEFIITPNNGKRFNNTKSVGGVEFITSTDEEDVKSTNREAIVAETPHGYKGAIEIGDIIIVHHNTFRHHYDMHGILVNSTNHFKDNLFSVLEEDFFLYKKPQGEWKANGRYCFVKPIKAKKTAIDKGSINEPLVGEMKYPNEYLISMGLKQGDTIVFTPDSEYEFNIDEEKLYRVYDHQITAQLN